MEIAFNTPTILLFSLIAQGVFTSVLLAFKRENRFANRFLALLVLLLSLWLMDAFFGVSGIYGQNPNFYFLPIYGSLGFGPLIFFYTRALTGDLRQFRWRNAIHFLPVILQFSFYAFLQTEDYTFRRNFWIEVHQPYTYDLELILSFGSVFIYLLLGRRVLKGYARKIENSFSSLQRITLSWLSMLHLVLSILALFWLFESLARMIWDFFPATPVSSITIAVTILLIGAGGILQKDLTQTVEEALSVNEDEHAEGGEAIDQEFLKQVQQVMQEKELYLQKELSLKEFAKILGAPSREVSHVINQGLGITFIDFVNQYRVKRVRAMLGDPQYGHYSLLGVALESGFNSKATFNRVFKKMEGKSPSEYRKAIQNAN
jgi:AraC-like DNA-binding protein